MTTYKCPKCKLRYKIYKGEPVCRRCGAVLEEVR